MADLFDIAIARKLSDGGGGGSSDFSTATVQYESNAIESAFIPRIDENLGIAPVVAENGIYNVPLYNGKAFGIAPSDAQPSSIVVNGSIVYDEGVFIITGNGSITIDDK